MVLLLLFSCTDGTVKEPVLPEPDTAASPGETINAPMGATTGEQIPNIVRELERLTGKRAGSASKGMALEDVVIDFSNIRWIIGQGTGRTNHTFPYW